MLKRATGKLIQRVPLDLQFNDFLHIQIHEKYVKRKSKHGVKICLTELYKHWFWFYVQAGIVPKVSIFSLYMDTTVFHYQ